MNRNFNKRIVYFITPTLFLVIILASMYLGKYIDFSVITTVYLPIWIIGAVAAFIGKIAFASVIIIFAGVGLVAEYLLRTFNKPYPNMSGAFLNTLILVLGLVIGIVCQILSNRKRKINNN